MTPLKVSVIIPAYNAEKTIAASIRAVLAQSFHSPVELIVVDDGSTDSTAAIVRSFAEVLYFYQPNSGPASARNRGAAEATGDLLFFTDADCCPGVSWLSRMSAGFSDPLIGVVAGSYAIANPDHALARIIHAEIRFRHLQLMPAFPRAFGSYNFSVTPDLFRRIGGFDVAYRTASGEDNDISYKVLRSGLKIRFLTDACVAHYHQTDLGKYLREQFRHGFWRFRLYADHVSMAGGDDYTFWKDIVEPPLAVAHLLVMFWPLALLALASAFMLFELLAGLWIIGFSFDGLLGGALMWLRSFSRAAGFLSGGVVFLKNRFEKGKKS
ncbi:MAG: glycosyltransferase [Candidatus Omnitrophota bacterium]